MLSDNTIFQDSRTPSTTSGGNAKLIWKGAHNLLVVGGEYEHIDWETNFPFALADTFKGREDRYGIFLNDTVDLGPMSVIPGARFDHTKNGDQWSPSFGIAWRLGDSSVLRGYTARGYSLPMVEFARPSEKIWTAQVGIESGVIPYLWLKGTLFRNELWEVLGDNLRSERRLVLGAEVEARTTPVFNSSISVGYLYADTTRASDGSQVLDAPRHTLKLALNYDDHQTFRGVLTGRHIWWNSDPFYNSKYGGILWDLNLGATLFRREQTSLELFFSGHNLFDTDQFPDIYINTGRWFEGGLKVRF